jgi:signal transduction histidine kinase
VVAAGTQQLRVDFWARSFVMPEQNRYRYRLDGYDDGWVDGGKRASTAYTNLPPGTYTFQVQSASGLGAWGPSQTAVFTLRPLFWQTWWFRLLLAALVVALLAAAYQYRVRHLLAMQRLRLRLASDLHDDVGSNLSSIALISEMLQTGDHHDDRERRQLQRLHGAAEDTVRALRDIIWLVDPEHDTLADLVGKMRSVPRTILNGTPCTFEVRAPIPPLPLDVQRMRNLFLIYKEVLHNIARHAEACHVTVKVAEQDGYFTIYVRDDGKGFDERTVLHGYGLANMRRRAKDLGGHIEVDSTPGSGTVVTFTAKIA